MHREGSGKYSSSVSRDSHSTDSDSTHSDSGFSSPTWSVGTESLASNVSLCDIRAGQSLSLSSLVATGILNKAAHFPVSSAIADSEQNGATSRFHLDGGSQPGNLFLRSVPQLLLYDDKGLELFERLADVKEYYVPEAEVDILQRCAWDMMQACVKDGGVLIELGVGSMKKTRYLLDAIVSQGKQVTYFALDLSEASLSSALCALADLYPSIQFVGLQGTYDDALAYIQHHIPREKETSRTLLWLGTSIGNSTREEAIEFCTRVRETVLSKDDSFLIGIDGRNPAAIVKPAYDDPSGITRDFILNGLRHVERLLGYAEGAALPLPGFEYVGLYNEVLGRHEAYLRSLKQHSLEVEGVLVTLEKGELLCVEYSVKYDKGDVDRLANGAGLRWVGEWRDLEDRYSLHCFQK
ncbi:histidine-specific methyltransferase [Chytriomyces sp. MP71]|nr:histidine-specific methyltransferase [Chytriomyces sp. MP71]